MLGEVTGILPCMHSYIVGIELDTNETVPLSCWLIMSLQCLLMVGTQPREGLKSWGYQTLVVRLAPATALSLLGSKRLAAAICGGVKIESDLIDL